MKELTLREFQLALLEILIEFDKVCRKNGLKYSLAGGTLLGAVRHKGFIPWDDDIDVMMPRPDYEAFVRLAEKAFTGHIAVSPDRGKDCLFPFLKLCDKNVRISVPVYGETEYLWIDIFPVDGLPDDREEAGKILAESVSYRKYLFYGKLSRKDFSAFMRNYTGSHSKLAARLIRCYVRIFCPKRRTLAKISALAARNPYETSPCCGVVTWGCYGAGEAYDKAGWENMTEVEFEGRKFPSIGCWQEYLSGIYGDYMRLPPEEKRHIHNIAAVRADTEEESK